MQEEGALLDMQLSISLVIGCFEKHVFSFLFFFQQLSLKLIGSCTSGSAPSPCIEFSMPQANFKTNSAVIGFFLQK